MYHLAFSVVANTLSCKVTRGILKTSISMSLFVTSFVVPLEQQTTILYLQSRGRGCFALAPMLASIRAHIRVLHPFASLLNIRRAFSGSSSASPSITPTRNRDGAHIGRTLPPETSCASLRKGLAFFSHFLCNLFAIEHMPAMISVLGCYLVQIRMQRMSSMHI